jgi:hypothetical protein
MTRQYRQGDVLLCAVDEIPSAAIPVPSEGDRVIVALGELTGHAHAFAARDARLFRDVLSGRSFLAIAERGTALVHEEHDPILVSEGYYELRRQREYAPKRQREYVPRRPRFVAD